jgi:hypothetical protein
MYLFNHVKQIIAYSMLVTTHHALSIDNPHFYRAIFFWGEPRFEKPWLSSIDLSVAGARTTTARNRQGKKTELLNIYGLHAMQPLGTNVPNLDNTNPLDKILIDLETLPTRDSFGKLLFSGKFHTIEAILNAYQNLESGFFFQAYAPVRSLKIKHITFNDLSPDDTITPNKNTPEWQEFLNNFDAIIKRHNLSLAGADRGGFGDFTLLAGWARNYDTTCLLDYVDVDAKVGILLPTGKKKDISKPFDMPLGYNGHYGFPLIFEASIGALEWLTVGLHLDALFFFNRTTTITMKTAENQNGFINLVRGQAEIDQGTIWDVSIYAKADHVAKGLSLLCGYTFTHQDEFCLDPHDKITFNTTIINHDSYYQGWAMHVLHGLVEYDFEQKTTDIGPRIGFFFNYIIQGKQIFDANTIGSYIGFDIAWCF